MALTFRTLTFDSPDYDRAVDLRRRVLRTPLGLDFTAEQLAAEASDTHLGVFHGDALVATVVLTPYGAQTVKLRQMAVSPDHQGQAIGGQLLAAAEMSAVTAGALRIVLAARVTAQAFYEKHGYKARGDIFTEVTIPHIEMDKVLGLN